MAGTMNTPWIENMETNIPELNSSALRRFTFVAAGILIGLFGIAVPWIFRYSFPSWPWIVSAGLAFWGVFNPSSLSPAYRAWMEIAAVLGKVNTIALLSAIYVIVIVPAGTLMRWCGYDPLQRKLQAHAGSYRKPAEHHLSHDMEKTY